MGDNNDKPTWWPENPYQTDNEWHRKSDVEKAWEFASDDCWDAYCKQFGEEGDNE